ncbi:MAG: putative N-acetylmannosaminyltransferase [Microgenomates bacterium OLB23]|nr:MAG: putative N-acetylmannosaminyltransferase [Microgenomates bacterium OLB23]
MRILDGTYAYLAAKVEGVPVQARIQGVDLMEKLLEVASSGRLRALLIGGAPKIAERVVECQKRAYPRLEIQGMQGIQDVRSPSEAEEKEIFKIVAATKPHLVFVAFGSPYQELWIDAHKKQFEGSVVMGVGGAFDFLSGNVPRAPKALRALGLEWLFRLIVQPWRIKRQLSVFSFFAAVVKEHIAKY